jgi:hypothetical protein
MDRSTSHPLVRSFERHLRAANRSDSTVASYVESIRQADRFLAAPQPDAPQRSAH